MKTSTIDDNDEVEVYVFVEVEVEVEMTIWPYWLYSIDFFKLSRTDPCKDNAAYRDARTHLKRCVDKI